MQKRAKNLLRNISYVQSQVPKMPWCSVLLRIQASLLIWLKVVKQAREPLGFFVKLRDDSQAPAGTL